ncbi:MAG: hypothetical protein E7586_01150 [Ruminococcaceae bacterium]|nr:hypothetical protein [Oscillospiraceae bacterium]
MKIKITSALICLVLLLTLLSGCVNMDKINGGSSEIPSKGEEISGESSVIDSSGESFPNVESNPDEPIDPPEIEEPDFFTKHGQGNLPEPSQIPAYCTATDTKYLYKSGVHIPDAGGFSIYTANGVLLFIYWDEDSQFCDMVSLETGKLIKSIPVGGNVQFGQFKNGGFWVADYFNLEVKFYDIQGNETVVKEGKEIAPERTPNTMYVTDDGKYLVSTHSDGARVEIYNLESGEVTKPTTPTNLDSWEIDELSNGIYFGDSVGSGFIYNIESGESQVIEPNFNINRFFDDICEISSDGYINLGSIFSDEQFYAASGVNGHLQDLKYGVAAISDTFTSNVTFSDLRAGVSVEVSATEEAYGLFSTLLENGWALIIDFSDKGNSAHFYDLASALRDENEATQIEALVFTEGEIKRLVDETAESVYAETGVELLYGSQGNDFDICDYVGVAELDLFKVYNSINLIDDIFEKYPQGMLKEVYSETNKGLKLYLCGDIYGVQQGSIDSAGGVTAEVDGYLVIALDINQNLWSVIPHELSHAFDNRIQEMSNNGETDWMFIWETFMPMDNAYTYSYDDYINNTDFTLYNENNPKDVWFTEGYARTFPTEDRACIMENLFLTQSAVEESDFYAYENLVNKAKLYSYILRQCFPSCNTDEVNYWETKLGVIDSSVVPDVESPVPVG